MYSILSGFGYGLWALFRDGTQHFYEREVDETLASLGPEVSNAGVRFYEKQLAKNIAIRGLSGDHSVYTSKGNLTYLFRNRHVPLTERKAFFKAKLKESEEEEEKEKDSKWLSVEEEEDEPEEVRINSRSVKWVSV